MRYAPILRTCLATVTVLAGLCSTKANAEDPIFGYWEPDGWWYPVVNVEILDQVARVKFHDGNQKDLPRGQVCRFALKVGTPVHGDWEGKGKYFPGKVSSFDGEQVQIQYDDGDVEDTTPMKLRLIPNGFNSLDVGQPVFAVWAANGYWYSGHLDKIDGERYFVKFNDGDTAWVDRSEITNKTIAKGIAVEGNFKQKGPYYPGTVTARGGKRVTIEYDDGDVEETTLRYVRVSPDSMLTVLGALPAR